MHIVQNINVIQNIEKQSVTYRYPEFPVPIILNFFGGIGTNWYRKKILGTGI